MTIKINLLQNQRDYKKLEDFFHLFRVGTVLVGFISLVSLIIIFAMGYYAQKSLSEAVSQQKSLVALIQKMEDKEVQILLIQEKIKAINNIINQTPDYAQQLETFLAFVPKATDSGQLRSILLDKYTAQAVVSFPHTQALTGFLDTIDQPFFQKTFTGVELSSISYSDPNKQLELQVYVGFKKQKN